MAGRRLLRGHPIYFDGTQHRFCDTNEPTVETWHARPCGHCGLYGNSNDGLPDPCIGMLDGVTNACCGHGEVEKAYIMFRGGGEMRGQEAVEFMKSRIGRLTS